MTRHTPFPTMQLAYGRVVEVGHPDGLYAVKVELHAFAGAEGQDGALWARVAAPFAGSGYGAVMLPNVDEEVIVGFVAGDMSYPIVLGALYTGEAMPADDPVQGSAVKRWSLTGQGGTHILLDESQSSEIVLETSGGVKITLSDSGQSATLTNGSSTTTIDPSGVTVETGANVTVNAAMVQVSASMLTVDAGMSRFSGVVNCDTLITNTVVAATYTPGAGNVW